MTEEHDEIVDPIDQRITDIEKHIENSRGMVSEDTPPW